MLKKIPHMADEEYRKLPYISVTQVCRRAVSKSAWEYHNTPPEETLPMLLGSLFDAMVTGVGLEKFKRSDTATKTAKAYKEEQEAMNAEGIKLVTPSEWAKAEAMAFSFKTHPLVKEKLFNVEFQVSYVDEENNIKGRLDVLQHDMFDACVWDIKTCSKNFIYAVRDYGYDMQLAAYMRMAGTLCGGWFVVDTTPPHEVSVYQIKTSTFQAALEKFDEYHLLLKEELLDETIKNKRNEVIQYV